MRRLGFTLVELSIVLVIIGLIVGGILAGQEMVRASELNRILTDKDRYMAAYNTFRGKYNALPGDMRNATDYWGTASGGCPSGARSGTQTCNGNGDGFIGGVWDGNNPTFVESSLAMQHLALSGLIQGSFTGYPTAGCTYCAMQIGTNAPSTSIQGATFMFYSQSTGHASFFGVVPKRALLFGNTGGDTYVPVLPALKPSETQAIDNKIDDGKPGTGIFVVSSDLSPNCPTTNVASTAVYNITATGLQCAFLFLQR